MVLRENMWAMEDGGYLKHLWAPLDVSRQNLPQTTLIIFKIPRLNKASLYYRKQKKERHTD